jgi:hypothetical protein
MLGMSRLAYEVVTTGERLHGNRPHAWADVFHFRSQP